MTLAWVCPKGMASDEAGSSHAACEEPDGAAARGSMRLSFARGLYHEVEKGLVRDLGAAHLVFGPNAGAHDPLKHNTGRSV